MATAFVRQVSSTLAEGERTHVARVAIDLPEARRQHAAYVAALQRLGLYVEVLPAVDSLPDATFVEDTCIVLDRLVVLTRPGAPSRRPEIPEMAAVLASRCRTIAVQPPATLDGGDAIVIGSRVLVGISTRTNHAGLEQLIHIAGPLGYTVETLAVHGALHLKSACTFLDQETAIANPEWVEPRGLASRVLSVPPHEPFGANALALGSQVLVSNAYPDTRAVLEHAGYETAGVDLTELHKAEAGVTCLSLIIPNTLTKGR